MNGIKMSDCRFYVDEAARTVVCVIPNTKEMVQNFIDEHFNFSDIDFSYITGWGWANKKLRLPYSFMGKAVCAPEDEWNEELGRMIAFNRAKDKCYRSFFKRANMLIQTVDRRLGDMITLFNDLGVKLSDKKTALEERIEKLIQKE